MLAAVLVGAGCGVPHNAPYFDNTPAHPHTTSSAAAAPVEVVQYRFGAPGLPTVYLRFPGARTDYAELGEVRTSGATTTLGQLVGPQNVRYTVTATRVAIGPGGVPVYTYTAPGYTMRSNTMVQTAGGRANFANGTVAGGVLLVFTLAVRGTPAPGKGVLVRLVTRIPNTAGAGAAGVAVGVAKTMVLGPPQ